MGRLGLVAVGAALGVMGVVGYFQEALIFHPERTAADFKYPIIKKFEEHFLTVGNENIHSLLIYADQNRGVLLFFHGNGGSLEFWAPVLQSLSVKTGWNVWAIDYPGYGKSTGTISSEEQLHQAAGELWSEAAKRFPGQKIVPYGRSIGSGLASRLAAEKSVTAVVLESPFYNLEQMAGLTFPWVPTFLLKYRFRSDQHLPNVKSPILIVHGERDEIVPYSQGEALAKTNPSARLVPVAEGHHNDLDSFGEYWDGLINFLNRF